MGEVSSEGGAIRSLSEMGVMLTMLTTGIKPGGGMSGTSADPTNANSSKTDVLVMETKAKIIEILQFILDVRLDYRITSLLSILKERVDDTERELSPVSRTGIRGIDLESIGEQAEKIFGNEAEEGAVLDLDGTGGKIFLRVLLHLVMHDYPPLVSGALKYELSYFFNLVSNLTTSKVHSCQRTHSVLSSQFSAKSAPLFGKLNNSVQSKDIFLQKQDQEL